MVRISVFLKPKEDFGAEIKDGEVIGWQPLTLKELNDDITACIKYLQAIKEAMYRSKEEV